MAHVFEPAASGRAKCRGCDVKIAKGELRFGERQPNAFGDGEMTLWFHPACAAFKRPAPFLEALDDDESGATVLDDEQARALGSVAELGVEHRRLPRLHGAERSPTGRARCRSCHEGIDKGAWRLTLVYFEELRFQPSGFIHVGCAADYFETTSVIDRVQHFSRDLTAADLEEIEASLG